VIETVGTVVRATSASDKVFDFRLACEAVSLVNKIPIWHGQFVQIGDERAQRIFDDLPVALEPPVLDIVVFPAVRHRVRQIPHGIFAFADADAIHIRIAFDHFREECAVSPAKNRNCLWNHFADFPIDCRIVILRAGGEAVGQYIWLPLVCPLHGVFLGGYA